MFIQPPVFQVPLGGWEQAAQCLACLWEAVHEEVTCLRITKDGMNKNKNNEAVRKQKKKERKMDG